ncbi:MAG TPA: hypothetical protein VEC16_00070 [Alphaproteobacteria bacterium]|nr:hypothetical protein [Alphaproteobacteria bacterium]
MNIKYESIKKITAYTSTIGAGILGILHASSHIIPAITNIGHSMSDVKYFGHQNMHAHLHEENINFLEQALHHPITNAASILFVAAGFYYIYKDHKYHKNESIMKNKIKNLEEELSIHKQIKHDKKNEYISI